MVKIVKSILIDAPVEKVFGYFGDPTNLPDVWPSLLEVRDVQRLPNGGNSFRYVYKLAGMRFEGTSEDIEYIPNQRSVTENRGGITSTITMTFQPEDARTKLTFVEKGTIPIPVLGKLAEAVILKMTEREIELMLANVKDNLEA